MYKVMLVDDEKLILQGLENLIDWQELNFEIVASAQNGKEAFEIYKKNPVDIIITDINMPIISGLELIEKIRNLNNNTRFIILSGYEDFNYAKKAIKYGVDNYILKPIDEEELTNTLKKIADYFETYKNKSKDDSIKRNIIKNYIFDNIDFQEFLSNITKFNFFQADTYFTVSILTLKQKVDYIDLDEMEFFKSEQNFEAFYDDFRNIIIINNWKQCPEKYEIKAYFQNILDNMKIKYNIDLFISIGKVVKGIENLPQSFKISNNIKKYVLKYGFNNCLDEDFIEKDTNEIKFNNEINEINKLILDKDFIGLNEFLDTNINLNKFSPNEIYDLSINILILQDSLKKTFKMDTLKFLGEEIIEIVNLTSIYDIKDVLKKKTVYLINNIQKDDIKYSPIIKRVLKCINDRYSEDLSLKTLSVEYNINSSYLGQVFHKEVGYSFSDYLNKVRNVIAKDLILNSNKKIIDIAKEVGYTDTSYFYRKFKKFYGVTPSVIRELKKF